MICTIPAIDILNGQVVRLCRGDYKHITNYKGSPRQIAQQIADLGYTNLHIIDIIGAKTGKFTISPILDDILNLDLSIQVGGGIRTLNQANELIAKGVDRIIVSTSALTEQHFFSNLIQSIESQRIILSLDVYNQSIATNGWSNYIEKTISSVLHNYPLLKNLIVTDINQDGTMSSNINYNLYLAILNEFPHINLIAAGGISSIDSIDKLQQLGCTACIIGKAYYEIGGLKEKIVARGLHKGEIC